MYFKENYLLRFGDYGSLVPCINLFSEQNIVQYITHKVFPIV